MWSTEVNILKLRLSKGLTQEELSIKLGCTQKQISQLESQQIYITDLTYVQQGRLSNVKKLPDGVHQNKSAIPYKEKECLYLRGISKKSLKKFLELKAEWGFKNYSLVLEKLLDEW